MLKNLTGFVSNLSGLEYMKVKDLIVSKTCQV